MTAEEKKMTREEAEKIVAKHKTGKQTIFCNGTKCPDFIEAKGFLQGRESGIRESAEVAQFCPEVMREILALLPDGREKEKS